MTISSNPKQYFIIVFLLLCAIFLGPSSGCHPTDLSALLSVKSAITSDPSGLLKTWNSSMDCCRWDGIDCDPSSGRVVNLTRNGCFWDPVQHGLVFMNMSGTISPGIGDLAHLRKLELSCHKQLTGPIPSSIGRLTLLKNLYLDGNSLTGTIPTTLGNLVHLKDLYLSDNQLVGPIPQSISTLSKLQLLYLSKNKLTGGIPSSISSLVSLWSLGLGNNKLTGNIPDSINGSFARLDYIDLSSNYLSGPIPEQIAKLPKLRYLFLSFNPLNLGSPPMWLREINVLGLADTGIVGTIPSWLLTTSIWYLDLSSNKLAGKLPTTIGNMHNLVFFNLSNNALESTIPKEFVNLRSLKVVDLHSNKFTGPVRPVLAKKTNGIKGHYRSINLSKNKFTGGIDNDIGELPAMDSLVEFDVSYNTLDGTIPESIGSLSDLTVVKMAGNQLRGEIPSKLVNLKLLTVLDVSENELSGEIPAHTTNLDANGFMGNRGLCGSPLPPCKH